MAHHGIRVRTTPVGDRYVLEALREEGGAARREQSGHIVWLGSHVAGDGSRRRCCCARRARATLSEAASVMPRYPQAKRNIHVPEREIPQSILDEVDRMTAELGDSGRILVRSSGTEPVVRPGRGGKCRRCRENVC